MARRRASMREGPLAELFRATEAAQRQKEGEPGPEGGSPEPPDPGETVESAAPFDNAGPEPKAPVVEESSPASPPADAELTGAPAPVAPAREAPSPPGQPERPYADRPAPPAATQPVRRLIEPAPRMRTTPRPDSAAYLAVIRVVGVGGAGLNAVNRMIEAGISQVEFIAVNTDIQQLKQCEAPIKLHIGRDLN